MKNEQLKQKNMDILLDRIPVLTELEDQVKAASPMNDEKKKELLSSFRNGFSELLEAKIKYLQLLEILADGDKEFNTLYQAVSQQSLSEAVDKLNSIGNLRKKNPVLRKAFQGMGYRLMEQTRAGKKDEVFHGMLRLYMTSNQSFDKELLIAFKQADSEMFKVLIFSFLSGIID